MVTITVSKSSLQERFKSHIKYHVMFLMAVLESFLFVKIMIVKNAIQNECTYVLTPCFHSKTQGRSRTEILGEHALEQVFLRFYVDILLIKLKKQTYITCSSLISLLLSNLTTLIHSNLIFKTSFYFFSCTLDRAQKNSNNNGRMICQT